MERQSQGETALLSAQRPILRAFAFFSKRPRLSSLEYLKYHHPKPFFIISEERYLPLS